MNGNHLPVTALLAKSRRTLARVSRLALVFSGMLVIGCADAAAPVTALAGDYSLVSLNDGALPQVIASVPPEVVQLLAGSVDLRDDGTFVDRNRWQTVTSYPFYTSVADSSAASGVYTVIDSTINLVTKSDSYTLVRHADGSLTRFFPRRSELQGPYLDVTYRYQRAP